MIVGVFVMFLWINYGEIEWFQNLREFFFYVVLLGSNIGFGNLNYILWMLVVYVMFLVLMLVGGMSGFIVGGMKVLCL